MRALAPVRVEDWTLFEGDGGTWVRDLDLAERASLAKPHDIRSHIAKAIKDGLLTISADGRNGLGAVVRVVDEVVRIGSGAARKVQAYYLDQEAALLVLMRLRTPKAVEVTKAVVRVFLAVARGEYVGVTVHELLERVGQLEAGRELDRQENLLLRAKIDLLDPTGPSLIGEARATMLRGVISEAARLACAVAGSTDRADEARERKQRDNEVREHVGFVQSVEHRWDNLPISDFGRAMLKAVAILGRERRAARPLRGHRRSGWVLGLRPRLRARPRRADGDRAGRRRADVGGRGVAATPRRWRSEPQPRALRRHGRARRCATETRLLAARRIDDSGRSERRTRRGCDRL